MALVWGGTLNSSAANFRTAVKGAPSGTLNLKINHRRIMKLKTKRKKKFNNRRNICYRNWVYRVPTYTLKGSFGSEVSVTLKDTFPPAPPLAIAVSAVCEVVVVVVFFFFFGFLKE